MLISQELIPLANQLDLASVETELRCDIIIPLYNKLLIRINALNILMLYIYIYIFVYYIATTI